MNWNSERGHQEPKKWQSTHAMVTDQPGRRLLFAGLLFSFLVAFVVQTQTSTEKITLLLRAALTHVHKDVRIEFSQAEFRLRDGLWPSFRLILRDVQMSSSQTCWLSPILTMTEVGVPLKIAPLLRGHSPFSSMRVGKAVLKLRGGWQDCQRTSAELGPQASAASSVRPARMGALAPSPSTTPKENLVDEDQAGNLNLIEIEALEVYHQEHYGKRWEVRNLQIESLSFAPRVFRLSAETNLFAERTANYLSSASVSLLYSEENGWPELTSQIAGHWREGKFSLDGHWSQARGDVTLATKLEQMPLVKLVPLWTEPPHWVGKVDPKKVWLSLSAQASVPLDKWQLATGEIKSFDLVGDLGEVSARQVRISQAHPLSVEPGQIGLKKFRVVEILKEMLPPRWAAWAGQGGEFTGEWRFLGGRDFAMNGVLTNLDFIFVSQERRAHQRANADIRMHSEKGELTVEVPRVELDQGELQGSLAFVKNLESEEQHLKFQFKKFRLAPEVEEIFWQASPAVNFEGQMDFRWQNKAWRSASGFVQAKELTVEGVQIVAPLMFFSTIKEQLAIRFKSGAVSIGAGSAVEPYLVDRLGVDLAEFKNLRSTKVLVMLRPTEELEWRDLELQSSQGSAKISTSGGWDSAAKLTGQLSLIQKGRRKEYSVQGTRDEPRLELRLPAGDGT